MIRKSRRESLFSSSAEKSSSSSLNENQCRLPGYSRPLTGARVGCHPEQSHGHRAHGCVHVLVCRTWMTGGWWSISSGFWTRHWHKHICISQKLFWWLVVENKLGNSLLGSDRKHDTIWSDRQKIHIKYHMMLSSVTPLQLWTTQGQSIRNAMWRSTWKK